MTYDTTAANTEGASVQNGSKIKYAEAGQERGEGRSTDAPQDDAVGQKTNQVLATDANQAAYDGTACENCFNVPLSSCYGSPSYSTMSSASDQETTTSKVPLNGSLVEDSDLTSGESSSSASSAPGSASSDGRKSFDDDCFVLRQQRKSNSAQNVHDKTKPVQSCYNPTLDNEIRHRLDKLNGLSDLINKLETQFDSFNSLFRETLKCSSHRLTSIAKTIGTKSIQLGRVYHDAKISVEQSQSECQRACVRFEQANHSYQFAKEAIREAESKLKQLSVDTLIPTRVRRLSETNNNQDGRFPRTSFEFSDLCKLKLDDHDDGDDCATKDDAEEAAPKKQVECSEYSTNECDNHDETKSSKTNSPERTEDTDGFASANSVAPETASHDAGFPQTVAQTSAPHNEDVNPMTEVMHAAKLSEDLNRATNRLIETEQRRSESEKQHLDEANKLMLAQENLFKLEREHWNSIRRSQIYFDEARQFNAKLSSLKEDIAKISGEISQAKQAYARALNELEQFSADLHVSSQNLENYQVN